MNVKEHTCPAWIEAYFDSDEESKSTGRILALAWVEGLHLQLGDRVKMPEVGWREQGEIADSGPVERGLDKTNS